MTEGTEAVGITEATGSAGVIEATDAGGARGAGGMIEAAGITDGGTDATDAEGWSGARGACATDADALRRSNSMKCVYDVRTKGKSYICLIQLYTNSEENMISL